jgi:hypothetical protein
MFLLKPDVLYLLRSFSCSSIICSNCFCKSSVRKPIPRSKSAIFRSFGCVRINRDTLLPSQQLHHILCCFLQIFRNYPVPIMLYQRSKPNPQLFQKSSTSSKTSPKTTAPSPSYPTATEVLISRSSASVCCEISSSIARFLLI